MNVPYQIELSVPPNTSEKSPTTVVLSAGVGNLDTVTIMFPDGVLGSVGVRVLEEGRQIVPMPSGWLYDNANTVSVAINRRLQGPPYRLVFQGISRALDWPHKIVFRLEMHK